MLKSSWGMRMQTKARPVVVTTEYRGVFFGYAEDTSGDIITLSNARNCIYWSAATGGFMGLAATGPTARVLAPKSIASSCARSRQ